MNDRVAKLEKLLAADDRDAFVLYGLAQEYAKAGIVGKAVEYYDRCLSSDPAYHYAYYHKAKALADADRLAEALQTLRAGVAAAKAGGDAKALNEMTALLDELE